LNAAAPFCMHFEMLITLVILLDQVVVPDGVPVEGIDPLGRVLVSPTQEAMVRDSLYHLRLL